MTSNKPRVYDALFELAPADGIAVDSGKPKAEHPVAYALCPRHQHEGRTTGLSQQGGHLVYRVHTIHTWGGLTAQCPASGATLCEVGVDSDAHRREATEQPECACTRTGGAALRAFLADETSP